MPGKEKACEEGQEEEMEGKEQVTWVLRSVRVGTIVDLETRNCRLRILLIDGTSRMIDDRRLLQGLPEVDKG